MLVIALVLTVIWFVLGVIGTIVLYMGYGFAMAAKIARDDPVDPSQRLVAKIDAGLAFPVLVLDAALNVFFFSFLMLDWRKGHTLTLVTERLCRYGLDVNERKFRRKTAAFFAAFTNRKDPKGWHVAGTHEKFTWLD